jgi:hypothetical protein
VLWSHDGDFVFHFHKPTGEYGNPTSRKVSSPGLAAHTTGMALTEGSAVKMLKSDGCHSAGGAGKGCARGGRRRLTNAAAADQHVVDNLSFRL